MRVKFSSSTESRPAAREIAAKLKIKSASPGSNAKAFCRGPDCARLNTVRFCPDHSNCDFETAKAAMLSANARSSPGARAR